MKKKKFLVVVMILKFILVGMWACQVQNEFSGQPFELYLLEDDQMMGAVIYENDLEDLPLAEDPLLVTEDVILFLRADHRMKLTEESYEKIEALFSGQVSMAGKPFVVLSYGERIYAGAFWTPLSSLSFDGVTIWQPIDPVSHEIEFTLGYPTTAFFTGQDPREDARLLQALEDAGKLK